MKFFFTVLAVLSVACAVKSEDANAALLRSLAKPCQISENATDDDLENLISMQPPTTREGKCLAACMGKQFGLITEDNKIAGDLFVAGIKLKFASKADAAQAVADACADVTDEDRCDAAVKIWECIASESQANGLDFTS